MTDVLVVGGGLGGCVAALAARQEDQTASVDVVAPNPGRFEHETGLVDVLGYTPDGDGPIARPLYEVRGLPDDHPYSRFGPRRLQDALSLFDDELGGNDSSAGQENVVFTDGLDDQEISDPPDAVADHCRYHRGGTELNGLVPTATGDVRPVSRYPASAASGLVSDDRPMRIVGFERETHLDADLAAERLDERVRYDVSATTVEFPYTPMEYPPAIEFASALDENTLTTDGTPVREALVQRLRPHLDVEPRLGFPAVLGLEETLAVRRDLESLLQAEVFEIPLGPPSVPGIRLREQLYDSLESHDVTVHRESRVGDIDSESGEIRAVETADGKTFEADAYVLATGGLDAGGIVATRTDVTEPTFDCHVPHPEGRADWTADDFIGDHPFARFGVEITDNLRPRDEDGSPSFENLRAAGSVIGGRNLTAEHSRAGVTILTGYEAGRLAVE